jgi:hypothetical protein
MAVEASQPLKIGHLLAKVDMKANQYGWVKLDAATGTLDIATDHVGAVGVLQNKPRAGDPCTVVVVGLTKLRVPKATAITLGQAISTVGYYLSTNAGANAPVGATGTHALVTAVVSCIPAAAT